jgi:transposase
LDRGKPIATCKGRRAEDVIAWCQGRPQAELAQVEVVVWDMSKTYASAIKALLGEPVQVMDRFHVVQQAVGTLDAVWRSVQKRLDAEEAKALKKLRKRWLKSANQLDVDEWIARYEWRRRFPELRAVLDWGQNLRMWFDRT